jgi:hypothetical protein
VGWVGCRSRGGGRRGISSFSGTVPSTPIFDNPSDQPSRLPNRGSYRSEEVMQRPRLGGAEPNRCLSRPPLVFVQEVVIVPVKSRHRYSLSAQRTAATPAMQATR